VGSNPTPGAYNKPASLRWKPRVSIPSSSSEDVVGFLWYCRKAGLRESTLDGFGRILKHLARHVNLNSPEQVLNFIAVKDVSEARKEVIVNCYARYCEWKGLPFTKPKYRRVKKLPFVPFENEVDMLISALPRRLSVFCQLIKETGARPGEAWNLKWVDVNPQTNTVVINKPEKNSNPRMVKVSSGLIARILSLPRQTEYVFKTNPKAKLKTLTRKFQRYKRQIANKLQNQRLSLISFLSLRHFKATMEYKRTKDILHVKELLGHVNIQNTLVYTHLVNLGETEYVCKVAKNSLEAQQLIEAGFEYVCTTPEGLMLFRKPK